MANKVHVKKDDIVYILSGKDRSTQDKAKTGKVVKVLPDKNKVVVEGVNVIKKHKKPRNRYEQGGIIEQPAPIDASKVMLKCPKCDKPTKVGKSFLENGDKARVCKKCGEVIDIVTGKEE